ncbi:hypothetical protein ACFC6L_30725 [Kitasatospora phosalacinea]|uniref:hypothetical protein n=1 Tax=Kitasatospora phosalacinea TaxID=2065 RepID=UPI0035E3AB76
MIEAFWSQAGGKLADRWAALSSSALVFWTGLVLVQVAAHGRGPTFDAVDRLLAHHGTATQVLVLLAGLLAVAASGVVVQHLTAPALRLAEGYWPTPLRPVRDRRLARVGRRHGKREERWQELSPAVQDGTATRHQLDEYARLEAWLRRHPDREADFMPTRVGNTLRAAETRPTDRYGVGVVTLWPHLWAVLPDARRQDVAAARLALDNAVAACLWAVLFVPASAPIAWWAPFPAAAVAVAAWASWIPARAAVFADLVEACYDLHRLDLYGALGVPAPANRQQERAAGAALTRSVLRGADSGPLTTAGAGATTGAGGVGRGARPALPSQRSPRAARPGPRPRSGLRLPP